MSKNARIELFLTVVIGIGLAGCSDSQSNQNSYSHHPAKQVTTGNLDNQDRLTLDTKNTTRIATDDGVKAAIETSQMVWPATDEGNRPGTILIGQIGQWKINLVAVDLIHHPNNGPLLYAKKDQIPRSTLNEIKRLKPKGSQANNGVQVIMVGNFSNKVVKELRDQNLKVDTITGKDPVNMAQKIDAYYANVSDELPNSVVVGSVDSPDYTLPAANWIAHMPEPLLYVKKDSIPSGTVEALKKRHGQAHIYILGPTSAVSAKVKDHLGNYGDVTRISGKTPEENAIAFAKFKDPQTDFGWGVDEPGHGLAFNNLDNLDAAIASAPFAHMGKHAPMLVLSGHTLSMPLRDYLASIKPEYNKEPTEGPYNHAVIIGSTKAIPFSTQGMIDEMLEIIPKNGEGHMNMGM